MTIDDLRALASAAHLLRPEWLWCLLVLPPLAWWWRRRRHRESVWRTTVDAHLLPHLLDAKIGARAQLAPWLLSMALALGIVALAGPTWRQQEQPLLQDESPLVIAVDLSNAMLANDLPPSRLLQARAKIAALLKTRAGGQVGLVAFADGAYTVAPLTDDASNVALFLDALSPDVMPVDGSNAAAAIKRSAQLLKQAGFASGDILVMGDHADADAAAAAKTAAGDGYRVSALGLGTAEGAAYRTPRGDISHAELDAGTLQTMARAGDGRYALLTPDDTDLQSLTVLHTRSGDGVAARGNKLAVWQDEGYWLLLPALVLMLFAFRRGAGFAVLLVCAWLPMQSARAADGGTLWRRADQVQQAQMQDGAQAYRKQDFAAAAQAWADVPGADADYNRGNALAKAGRYEDALAAYNAALRKQPSMPDAAANKAAVEAAMKRKPPPSKQHGGRNDKHEGDGGKPQDGKKNPQDSSSASSDEGQQGGQPPSDKGKQDAQPSPERQDKPSQGRDANPSGKAVATPPQTSDAQVQQQADAQQRQQMQQALKQNAQGTADKQDGAQVAAQPGKRESAQEREKRQATEAWLRRVPDDPGGLLRAKFRLEYERRQDTGEQ